MLKHNIFSHVGRKNAMSTSISRSARLGHRAEPQACQRFNSSLAVPLAFDRWEPPTVNPQQPALIYAHGVFGNRNFGRSLMQTIAETLQTPLYSVDLRNHGESPRNPVHNYPVLVEDLSKFIKQQEFTQAPAVFGFSMGAKTAMATAIQYPSLISRVVSIDQGPMRINTPFDLSAFVQAIIRVREAKVADYNKADEVMKPAVQSRLVREYLLSTFQTNPVTGVLESQSNVEVIGRCIHSIKGFEYSENATLPSPVPVLIIRGLKSPYVPDERIPEIRKLFSQLQLADIENGAHTMMIKLPELVAKEAVKFLRVQSPVEDARPSAGM